MSQALAPYSDEGLALETALNIGGHSYIINLVGPTKLPFNNLFIYSKKLAWNSDTVICILFFLKSKSI